MLWLLQELFSLLGSGRNETGYKHFNIWLGNSSRSFRGFYVSKPGSTGSPCGSQSLVIQKGRAEQGLSFHNSSTIHEAKLGTQKKAEARAHPTYITWCVGGICLSYNNTSLSAQCCSLVNQPHKKATWQHMILMAWALQHSGIFTPPPFTRFAQWWGHIAQAGPGTTTRPGPWAGFAPFPPPLVSGSLWFWKPSWEWARAQPILHQSESLQMRNGGLNPDLSILRPPKPQTSALTCPWSPLPTKHPGKHTQLWRGFLSRKARHEPLVYASVYKQNLSYTS